MDKTVIVFSSHRSLESGGVGTHLRHLISEISQSNYSYRTILGLKKESLILLKLNKIANKIFLGQHTAETLYFVAFISKLAARLESEIATVNTEKIIVHCHDKYTAIAASIIKRADKKRDLEIIQTLHAPFYEQFKITHKGNNELISLSKLLDIGMTTTLDGIIGVDTLQVQLANKLLDKHFKVTNISNAVDVGQLDMIENAAGKKDIEFERKKYFVIARHLQEKNGVIYGVEAFNAFNKLDPSYGLIILGEGPERERVEKYINDNDLQQKVKLMGRQDHVDSIRLISNAYASIIPSVPVGDYIEATSLTMLESMYLGVPVLASNIGGLAEVLEDGENGLLFEPAKSEEITAALQRITQDGTVFALIKDNAKKTILNNYTSKLWFDKIRKFYES
ncbi:glycosyltransferase [Sphingobacterium puteale]|uniref:Glycosyltransferase n=1 Tax=Sphingobacterium puteale TaxID=2420510 RepID=A0A420VQQ5_9SPHI|nr:glycosyltransferase family 4 protein [Sphingobacterium puteale]RKO68670.1 glycosyltransferase [Sphingobacterium puteale]